MKKLLLLFLQLKLPNPESSAEDSATTTSTDDPAAPAFPSAAIRRARTPPAWLTRETVLIALTLLAILGATVAFPRSFPTFANLSSLLRNNALDGVMACGMVNPSVWPR